METITETIKELNLDNVTVFDDLVVKPVSGLNIILGTNSTGKTHLLKLIHTIHEISRTLKNPDKRLEKLENKERFAEDITEFFTGNFFIKNIGRLTSRVQGHKSSHILAHTDQEAHAFSIGFSTRHKVADIREQAKLEKLDLKTSIFIPSREILSDFITLLSDHQLGEEKTEIYYAILAAYLAKSTGSGRHTDVIREYIHELEQILNGSIVYKPEEKAFYIRQSGIGEIEMGLAADGHKKIGMLIHLIKNGVVSGNETLLIDEPETSLNASSIKPFVRLLFKLAQNGNQMFVSTHDYFFLKYAEMLKDEFPNIPIQFINLYKTNKRDKFVATEASGSVYDIVHNAVFNEFEEIHKETMKQFWHS